MSASKFDLYKVIINEPINREIGKYNLTPIEAMVINMHLPFGTKLELETELKFERVPKMRYRKTKFKPLNQKTRLKTLKYVGKPLQSPDIVMFTKAFAAYKKITNNYYAQDFMISYNPSTPSLSIIDQRLRRRNFTSFHDFKRAVRQLWLFYYINYEKRQDIIQKVGIMSSFSEEVFDHIEGLNENELMIYLKEDDSVVTPMIPYPNMNVNMNMNYNTINANNNNMNNNNTNSNNTYHNHFTSNSSNNEYNNNNNNGQKTTYFNELMNVNYNINEKPMQPKEKIPNRKPQNPNASKIVIYKEMTLEDKNKLNEKVNRLTNDQLLGIIPLLDAYNCTSNTEYFEFDIETLNAVQFNKLKKYVSECLDEEQKSSIDYQGIKSYPNDDSLQPSQKRGAIEHINQSKPYNNYPNIPPIGKVETSMLINNNPNATMDEYNKALSDSGSFDLH